MGSSFLQIRAISADLCHELAPPESVISWVREAQIAVSSGKAVLPLRRGLPVGDEIGTIGIMPGYLQSEHSAGIKLVSLVPPERRKVTSHHGLFIM